VIKFEVAWLCDLMIRIPSVFAIPGTGFRHSLPEWRGRGWETSPLD